MLPDPESPNQVKSNPELGTRQVHVRRVPGHPGCFPNPPNQELLGAKPKPKVEDTSNLLYLRQVQVTISFRIELIKLSINCWHIQDKTAQPQTPQGRDLHVTALRFDWQKRKRHCCTKPTRGLGRVSQQKSAKTLTVTRCETFGKKQNQNHPTQGKLNAWLNKKEL